MPKFLVAVGGSGQHTALAVVRLVRIGALPNDINLIVLDSDNDQELSTTLLRPWDGVDGPDTHPLKLNGIYPPFARAAKDPDTTFRDLFLLDSVATEETALFDMIFDAEEEEIPVARGMYGTPCVGATVFSDGTKVDTVANLLGQVNAAEQVFFTGSVMGGTGAGILHKLVETVREKRQGPMYGMFLTRWFQVPPTGKKGAITPEILRRNLAHGMTYFYKHTIPQLNASVFLGQPKNATEAIEDLHLAEGDNSEQPHYVHLAAANSLFQLPMAERKNNKLKAYCFAHNSANEDWLLDETWHDGVTLRMRIFCAMVERDLLRHLVDHREDIRTTLTSFLAKADAITKQLYRSVKDNAKVARAEKDAFADDVVNEFARIHGELDFCLKWFTEIYPEAYLQRRHKLLQDLAKNDSQVKWELL